MSASVPNLDPPRTSFASDNTATMHPRVADAIVAANSGAAVAYGEDPWTDQARDAFAGMFGPDVATYFTFGGTGANIVGLQPLLRPYEAVICPESAHINVDECGAPERFLGAKLLDVPTEDGKLRPEHITKYVGDIGMVHHIQPKVVALTQSTEMGTVYSPAEIAALAEVAHRHDMYVHMDGARFANAVAALGCSPRETANDVGVDVLTFGGTKAGLGYGEAVVVFRPELAEPTMYAQKQAAQLPSKMRFVAAQFLALLDDDLWINLARHANAMATALARQAGAIAGVDVTHDPEVNAVFARIPDGAYEPLADWSFFWPWDPSTNLVRWMTNFETTQADIDTFVRGIETVIDML